MTQRCLFTETKCYSNEAKKNIMKQECNEKNKNKIYKGDILSLQLTITNNEFINRSLITFE